MTITAISHDDLEAVHGGAAASDQGSLFYPSSEAIAGALESPSARMSGVVNPGGQVFERSNAGPSAYERVNNAFDNSTRAMRTFNEIGGAFTQAPGFGNGDVLKP
ncbi:MAG: hypothetical protein HOV81_15125 [Kofleriaceae bacterium]|nr:hypothetical protein [Kofleriaceae bacterium]